MKKIGRTQGASDFTHKLKEYGGGSMKKGLERCYKQGYINGAVNMIQYLQRNRLLKGM